MRRVPISGVINCGRRISRAERRRRHQHGSAEREGWKSERGERHGELLKFCRHSAPHGGRLCLVRYVVCANQKHRNASIG